MSEFTDKIDQLVALLEVAHAALADLDWKPISTAPKNEVIWACDAGRGYDGKVMHSGGKWMCINFDQFGMDIGFYPTHWQPLPKLPKVGQ